VRLVAGQLQWAEFPREGEVLLVVDVSLIPDTQHRVFAHEFLDQLDGLSIGVRGIDADQLGGEQRMELVDFDSHGNLSIM
jgi:hypothetical protein